jgi:hypothetical protein
VGRDDQPRVAQPKRLGERVDDLGGADVHGVKMFRPGEMCGAKD